MFTENDCKNASVKNMPYTVSSTNIGTLGKYEQKIHKILTHHWSKTIESGVKISLWNKCFL